MMAAARKFFDTVLVEQTSKACSASLIFLHGSGDTGMGLKIWVKEVLGDEFAFPHIRVIYPTAPIRSYTPMLGQRSNVWFDRKQISPFVPEDESVTVACKRLSTLINSEVESGILINRIIVGGFSMGGCAALHLGYRFHRDIAGVFGMSSFLNEDSNVYKELGASAATRLPLLFQSHGQNDVLVLHEWGRTTFDKLQNSGVVGEFHSFDNLYHQLNREGLQKLRDWIVKILPDTEATL